MSQEENAKISLPEFAEMMALEHRDFSELLACSIAMKKFNADFLEKSKKVPRYAYSVMEDKDIYYVHFFPNFPIDEGVMFGGAVTYAVNIDTQTVVAGKIYK